MSTYRLKVDMPNAEVGAIYHLHEEFNLYVGAFKHKHTNSSGHGFPAIEIQHRSIIENAPDIYEKIEDSGIKVCPKCEEIRV